MIGQEPGTGRPLLNKEMCATCPGRPDGVKLRPGRIRDLVRSNTGETMGLVCHETIEYRDEGEARGNRQALCRWFFDNFGNLCNGVRIMERLGGFCEVDPPQKAGEPQCQQH